ncbi:MAG: zinc-ribbon domain-containing protein [Lachnospiraceae bacterium]|nr:zinc-ribbon domain-containing protein [Lachnospiraceae bacterium]
MALINCPECRKEIEEEVLFCPNCGFPIKKQNETEQPVYKNKRYIGIAMCIIGCVLFIVAFARINNDDYKFYLEHYETCMQGYDRNTETANSYTSGYFKSSYENIASTYKEMAEDDYKEIWKYRIEAIVACGAGLILLVIGCKNITNKGK